MLPSEKSVALFPPTVRSRAVTLKEIRAEIEQLDALIGNLKTTLEANPVYQQYLEMEGKKADARHLETAAKKDLSDLMVAQYNETKDKQFPGIGNVAVREVVEYREEDAVAWAIKKDEPGLLRVDKAGFKAVAKAMKPDFVTVKEEPYARVSGKIELDVE